MLQPGSRVGPYEIVAPLGAGGMGEVYRARDPRLARDVAVKVLPEEFFEDDQRRIRFEREARLLAALNHPGIAAIHSFEEVPGSSLSSSRHLLVMELVEGDDLAQRLASGPLPVEESLSYAKQIAEGLEAAHEKGIVHRDLKPANVKVTPDGRVKLLDFGLAKIFEEDGGTGSSPSVTRSPTLSARATAAGMILGTAAYMSPEQARGKPLDKRTDVWAFGCVLYEMLTGKRAFEGETVSDTLAAVLTKQPDWSALGSPVSAKVRELLRRCLQRDTKQRLRDIGDARIAIEEELGTSETVALPEPAVARSRNSFYLSWAIAAACAVAAGALALRARAPQETADARSVRLAFLPPDGVAFDATLIDFLAVSPNGRLLVFTGGSADGKRQLWLRALDSSDARPLPGTEDGLEPFWSPDSRSIGFGAQGKLKRLDLAGGRPLALADAPRLVGGTWNRDGVILFMPNWSGKFFQIPARGGQAKPLKQEGRNPSFLPDGRHFLYSGGVAWQGPQVCVGSLDSNEQKTLVSGAGARYAPPGRVLFVRDGALIAQAFDVSRREFSGDPIPIDTAQTSLTNAGIPFSVSDNGVLVWQRNLRREYQLAWFDRAGRPLGTVGPTRKVNLGLSPTLSPDDTRVVVANREPQDEKSGIWVIDVARGLPTRMAPAGQMPSWSPEGTRVIWQGAKDGVIGMFRRAANGVAGEEMLLAGPNTWTNTLSPDGRFLLYVTRGEKTRADIWALPLVGDRKPHPVLATEFEEVQAQLSPDGRWLAYRSDLSGTYEIYVQPFTAEGTVGEERWRISGNGGTQPRFRRDGQELFYLADDGQLMAVTIQAKGKTFQYDPPRPLFVPRMLPRGAQPWFEYDVARDGQRFLIGTVVDEAGAPPPSVVVVLNWTEELKAKAVKP